MKISCFFAETKIKDMERKEMGSEKKFEHEFGKVIVGTVNKRNCKSVYVRLECYVKPEVSLVESIAAIRRKFIANQYKVSRTYFERLKSTMIDYGYPQTKGTDKPGKVSFISIEITLFAENVFEFDKDFIFAARMFGDTMFTLLESIDSIEIVMK